MQNDIIVLNQIAVNERVVEHSEYGNFLISRPTHKILADIESYRTRAMNRDLQTRDVIVDPLTGEKQYVPAYLTHQAKAEQLKFHGIWTDEDVTKLEAASTAFRDICAELEKEGFEGVSKVEARVNELRAKAIEILKDKFETDEQVREAVDIIFSLPYGAIVEDAEAKFGAARDTLMKASRTHAMSEVVEAAQSVYKQSMLCRRALQAQAELVALRMREIELFRDTVESRADQAARVAKVFYCTKHPLTKKPYWETIADLEAEPSEKIGWIFEQIEKFERLESVSEEEQERKDRFNFLRFLWELPSALSDDSPEAEPSKQDGDSPETPTVSTELSATPTTN